MIDKSAIDPNALHYYRLLKQAGFSAYFVGGSVRDLLLGKHPKDFDIATNATPHQIKRIIPHGRIIGRRFRHVMLERDGGRYEIVTFRGPILPAQATEEGEENAENEESPVEEQQDVQDNRRDQRRQHPDLNQFGNAQQDAIRRDFTINALFYDPDSDELVDYVEGKLDIDRKIIRCIGDAVVRMEEDPIRILRAIRHRMKLGLAYDESLENAMREKAPLLEQTSKDRIREEFLKVCNDQSLGLFLQEIKRLGISNYITPWFSALSEEEWEKAFALWKSFQDFKSEDKMNADMGLAFMMTPLVPSLVLEPYRATLKEGEKNYLPDMKYFLSCEPLRNYYLRNLRISRAQTDHIVRTLFYWSRMTGLWTEQGPPRRIIGRLFQHPPALLAAKMARVFLLQEGKEVPAWMAELADYNPQQRKHKSPREHQTREHSPPRHSQEDSARDDAPNADAPEEEREESAPARQKQNRLPIPDAPMVWNGPLHAPVLRPKFSEEQVIRWARKNQTVRAFRPSGVPNQPTDYAALKAHLVTNYKPELETIRNDEDFEPRRSRDTRNQDRRNGRNRGRDRDRGNDRRNDRPHYRSAEAPVQEGQDAPPMADEAENLPLEEDSIGNQVPPGNAAGPNFSETNHNLDEPGGAPHEYGDDYEDEDDNIGNRLDAPPTSGHIGVNGEGVLNRNGQAPSRGHRPSGDRSGGGPGGHNRRRGRRGGRNRHRSGGPRHSNQNNPR